MDLYSSLLMSRAREVDEELKVAEEEVEAAEVELQEALERLCGRIGRGKEEESALGKVHHLMEGGRSGMQKVMKYGVTMHLPCTFLASSF